MTMIEKIMSQSKELSERLNGLKVIIQIGRPTQAQIKAGYAKAGHCNVRLYSIKTGRHFMFSMNENGRIQEFSKSWLRRMDVEPSTSLPEKAWNKVRSFVDEKRMSGDLLGKFVKHEREPEEWNHLVKEVAASCENGSTGS